MARIHLPSTNSKDITIVEQVEQVEPAAENAQMMLAR